MSIPHRLLVGGFIAVAGAFAFGNSSAEARQCFGPYCNSGLNGCEIKQSSTNRPCCCDPECTDTGCECYMRCWTGCSSGCPSDACNNPTCSGFASVGQGFTVTNEIYERVRQAYPQAAGLLRSYKRAGAKAIGSAVVRGGASLYTGERFGFKVNVVGSGNALTLDYLFFGIGDLPKPKNARVEIDTLGNVRISPLPDEVAKTLSAPDPQCPQDAPNQTASNEAAAIRR